MSAAAIEKHLSEWSACAKCSLANLRTQVVQPRGVLPCDFLFVGEAPGQFEDIVGRPFVGPAGQLLDTIIKSAIQLCKWEDEQIPTYAFDNVVACVPNQPQIDRGGVRPPTSSECETCRPRLLELIRLSSPEGIIAVGDTAATHLKDLGLPLVEILHPAAILRNEDRNAYAPLVLEQVSIITNFFNRNHVPY